MKILIRFLVNDIAHKGALVEEAHRSKSIKIYVIVHDYPWILTQCGVDYSNRTEYNLLSPVDGLDRKMRFLPPGVQLRISNETPKLAKTLTVT